LSSRYSKILLKIRFAALRACVHIS
jgi:hypothetical protein